MLIKVILVCKSKWGNMLQKNKTERKNGGREIKTAQSVSDTALKKSRSKKKTREIAGIRLINKIRAKSIELGLQDRYIADMIGVTPIYWYSIANGHRKISSLAKDKLKKIAEFLNIPTVQAMSLADVLDQEDFSLGRLEDQLEMSIRQMRDDQAWMCWAPTQEEWDTLSVSTRTGIVMLYETVFYKSFLRRAAEISPELKGRIQTFVETEFIEKNPSEALS